MLIIYQENIENTMVPAHDRRGDEAGEVVGSSH